MTARHTVTGPDGLEIATYDFGGAGPDLLLAHATGFHGRSWLPLARRLAERFRCVAFDERAHGDTAVGHGRFEWEALAADTAAVVDGMGLERPYAVGHSCGGALVLLAEEARPGTFRALYCFEPIVAPLDDPVPAPNPLAARARRRRETFASREDAYEHLAARPALARFSPEALEAYVAFGFDDLDDGTVRLKCRGEHEARVYEHGLIHSAFRQLARVQCPVTLACGERSDVIGPSVLQRLASRLPRVSVEVVPGVGHFGPMEDPDRLAAAVTAAFA